MAFSTRTSISFCFKSTFLFIIFYLNFYNRFLKVMPRLFSLIVRKWIRRCRVWSSLEGMDIIKDVLHGTYILFFRQWVAWWVLLCQPFTWGCSSPAVAGIGTPTPSPGSSTYIQVDEKINCLPTYQNLIQYEYPVLYTNNQLQEVSSLKCKFQNHINRLKLKTTRICLTPILNTNQS